MEEKKKKHNAIITLIIILIIAVVTVATVMIVSNIQNAQTNYPSYSADYITQNVIDKMNYQNLTKISNENISKYYDLPKNIVSDSSLYISNRSGITTEVACFKLTDTNNQDRLLGIINDYTSSKVNSYKSVKDTTVETETKVMYPYVFVVISDNSSSAVNAFESILTKNRN